MNIAAQIVAVSVMAPVWAVFAALIPAAGALIGQWFVRLKEARDRRRDEYSRAFAAAMLWLEFPYRIARRLSNDPAEVNPIVLAMHEAQQQIEFHSNWLGSVSDEIANAYGRLVRAVKQETRMHIEEAGGANPRPSQRGMILGDTFAIDVASEIEAFTRGSPARPFPAPAAR